MNLSHYTHDIVRSPSPNFPHDEHNYGYEYMDGNLSPRSPVRSRPGSVSVRPTTRLCNNPTGSYGTSHYRTMDTVGDLLPHIDRPRTIVPSYDKQMRYSTPAPPVGSWVDNTDSYYVDDSAGMLSINMFKKGPTLPLNRSGRLGGHWRHIQQITAQSGANILFIDGTVKANDVNCYPPYGILSQEVKFNHLGQRLLSRRLVNRDTMNRSNQFNQRAKNGFKYWYEEPKANILEPANRPVRTISGHQLRTSGVGYCN